VTLQTHVTFPSNGRGSQFSSRQPRELILGMQHSFTNLDELWKTTSIVLKMEDASHFFFNWKTNSILFYETNGADFRYAIYNDFQGIYCSLVYTYTCLK
jgi:hypothetical protein